MPTWLAYSGGWKPPRAEREDTPELHGVLLDLASAVVFEKELVTVPKPLRNHSRDVSRMGRTPLPFPEIEITGEGRCDREAPNESSVAQLGAELWPETCFGRMCMQIKAASTFLFGALDDHPCMHYRPKMSVLGN